LQKKQDLAVLQTNGSGVLSFSSVSTDIKAWVNFNGEGTVSIRANFNVSSITDNGTGNYTVNFTNALTDTNYCVLATGDYTLGGEGIKFLNVNSDGTSGSKTTTAVGITSFEPAFSLSDIQGVYVAVFR